MDRKRNQAALKGKEKVRAPPTRISPMLAALRAPQSPPLKMQTPPSRASPRLTRLNPHLLQCTCSERLRTPIPEIPRMTKTRKTARISVKPVWRQFSERVIAKGGPSTVATKEKVVINDSSDSEISEKIEVAAMELIAMDEPFIPEIEHVRDEEDYEGFSAEDDDSSNGSTGSN
ncbi:hypothetical protein PIB30_032793 [Stylosanthes scabra]|uniref:Uncharacterized protein n=1 Tax=Stylosanthes scabra TaxID=79078 RepID=A0ABU6WED7_9FABA|nr:hypothetical protein [Stylosanthes scabra]